MTQIEAKIHRKGSGVYCILSNSQFRDNNLTYTAYLELDLAFEFGIDVASTDCHCQWYIESRDRTWPQPQGIFRSSEMGCTVTNVTVHT